MDNLNAGKSLGGTTAFPSLLSVNFGTLSTIRLFCKRMESRGGWISLPTDYLCKVSVIKRDGKKIIYTNFSSSPSSKGWMGQASEFSVEWCWKITLCEAWERVRVR